MARRRLVPKEPPKTNIILACPKCDEPMVITYREATETTRTYGFRCIRCDPPGQRLVVTLTYNDPVIV